MSFGALPVFFWLSLEGEESLSHRPEARVWEEKDYAFGSLLRRQTPETDRIPP
jgi:hypothetical protein